jgi:hypothetical protein
MCARMQGAQTLGDAKAGVRCAAELLAALCGTAAVCDGDVLCPFSTGAACPKPNVMYVMSSRKTCKEVRRVRSLIGPVWGL